MTMRAKLFTTLISFLALSSIASAQIPTSQPNPRTADQPVSSYNYLYHGGVFCGMGATTSSAATKPTAGCGIGMSLLPLPPAPIFVEAGVMGPQASHSNFSGYLSIDSVIPVAHPSLKYIPLVIVGYSRLFETGHAFDYGVALDLPRFGKPKDEGKALRIELRDYYTFANPTQHNVMLRVGWIIGLPD